MPIMQSAGAGAALRMAQRHARPLLWMGPILVCGQAAANVIDKGMIREAGLGGNPQISGLWSSAYVRAQRPKLLAGGAFRRALDFPITRHQ